MGRPSTVRLRFKRAETLYERFCDTIRPPELGSVFSSEALVNFRQTLCRRFFGTGVPQEAIDSMLDPLTITDPGLFDDIDVSGVSPAIFSSITTLLGTYYGKKVTPALVSNMYWRLAAGMDRLVKQEPLYAAFTVPCDEWVPARIEDILYGRPSLRTGAPTLAFVFRLLDGCYAGLSFTQVLSYKFCLAIQRDIGLPRSRLHKNEYALTWLAARLLVLSAESGPRLEEFDPTPTVQTHNRSLYKSRKEPCGYGWSWPCLKCSLGHSRANDLFSTGGPSFRCPRATHSIAWRKRGCGECSKEGWFDVADTGSTCIGCRERQTYPKLKLAAMY